MAIRGLAGDEAILCVDGREKGTYIVRQIHSSNATLIVAEDGPSTASILDKVNVMYELIACPPRWQRLEALMRKTVYDGSESSYHVPGSVCHSCGPWFVAGALRVGIAMGM